MAKVQTEIAGTERPSIPGIDDAARDYVVIRDERMAVTPREVTAKQVLTAKMEEHRDDLEETPNGEKVYVFDDAGVRFTCTLEKTEKVKVRRVADEGGQDDGEEDIG